METLIELIPIFIFVALIVLSFAIYLSYDFGFKNGMRYKDEEEKKEESEKEE